MKKLKKIVALFSAALLCLLPIFAPTMTAQASTPTTWYIKYVDDISEWRFQKGTWEATGYHRELYYMHQDIQDGDLIVIDGTGDIELTVDARLSNLTVLNTGNTVVTAKGIDNFYAGDNTVSAINCDVTNAYVYNKCIVNFNKNVSYLELICKEGPKATVAAVGTVGHLKGWDGTTAYYERYNFAAGKLLISEGILYTEASDCSTSPSTPAASTPATSAPSTPTAPSAGEYDDVPKTGSLAVSPLWLLGIAVLCLIGSSKLERR